MTSAEERVELARKGFDAYQAADPATVLALLHPDVVVYADPSFMNAGTFHGHQGFIEWTAAWNEAWESFHIEVQSIEPVGERHVLIEVLQTGRGRSSGAEIWMEACYVQDIREGVSVYLGLYPDVEAARAAALEREGG